MDTKLKNSEPKYHSSVKFVAILLTAVTAFLTGMCGLNFLRTAVFYADEKGGGGDGTGGRRPGTVSGKPFGCRA